MSSYHWSLAVWGLWFGAFVVLELLAVKDWVPWNTLSWTSWELQSRSGVFSVAFLAGLFVLLIHVAFRWPSKRYQPPQEDER